MRLEPVFLTKAQNTSHVNGQLGEVLHHKRVGKPCAGSKAQIVNDHFRSVAVAVERKGVVCTLPDGRSTWFWKMLNADAVVTMLSALDLATSMPVSWPNQEASHSTSESAKSVPRAGCRSNVGERKRSPKDTGGQWRLLSQRDLCAQRAPSLREKQTY